MRRHNGSTAVDLWRERQVLDIVEYGDLVGQWRWAEVSGMGQSRRPWIVEARVEPGANVQQASINTRTGHSAMRIAIYHCPTTRSPDRPMTLQLWRRKGSSLDLSFGPVQQQLIDRRIEFAEQMTRIYTGRRTS